MQTQIIEKNETSHQWAVLVWIWEAKVFRCLQFYNCTCLESLLSLAGAMFHHRVVNPWKICIINRVWNMFLVQAIWSCLEFPGSLGQFTAERWACKDPPLRAAVRSPIRRNLQLHDYLLSVALRYKPSLPPELKGAERSLFPEQLVATSPNSVLPCP